MPSRRPTGAALQGPPRLRRTAPTPCLGLAPNSYTVEFDPVGQDYVDEFYNDETEMGSADTINVAAGSTQNGIDATLAAGASISGTVTDGGGSPLGGIEVHVVATDGSGNGGTAFTRVGRDVQCGGAAGRQLLGEVDPAGRATLDQFYNGEAGVDSADAITLTSGEAKTSIDAAMAAPGSIAGMVTDSQGNPISGVSVYVTPSDGTGSDGQATTKL